MWINLPLQPMKCHKNHSNFTLPVNCKFDHIAVQLGHPRDHPMRIKPQAPANIVQNHRLQNQYQSPARSKWISKSGRLISQWDRDRLDVQPTSIQLQTTINTPSLKIIRRKQEAIPVEPNPNSRTIWLLYQVQDNISHLFLRSINHHHPSKSHKVWDPPLLRRDQKSLSMCPDLALMNSMLQVSSNLWACINSANRKQVISSNPPTPVSARQPTISTQVSCRRSCLRSRSTGKRRRAWNSKSYRRHQVPLTTIQKRSRNRKLLRKYPNQPDQTWSST